VNKRAFLKALSRAIAKPLFARTPFPDPALRGTEDYVAYPNGLVWRRLTYESLKPDRPAGYSWQPVDFFSPVRNGLTWADVFTRDTDHGDYFVGSVIDGYSNKRYDKFWDDAGNPRRNGNAELLLEISRSRGLAMVVSFRAGHLFTILGPASGFPSDKSQAVDHSFQDTGGWGWGAVRWDHWPVGWLNSQDHVAQAGSPSPYHFAPFSHYVVNKPLRDAKVDYPRAVANMKLNRWSGRHVYYTLTGVRSDMESIRKLIREWLDPGENCASPDSVAGLR